MFRTKTITLPPFPTAEWYLALDQLQNMQLQHWVHDSKNAFQHSLLATSSQIILREANQLTYRAFVLDKHPDTMGSAFGQLLHNLSKINGRKKVTP
jgi:hypothetical protein